MNLKGKNVVITGATGGIGSAIAEALHAQGCKLLLTGRSREKLESLLARLADKNHTAIAVNLRKAQQRTLLLRAAARQNSDILINALGTNQLSLLHNTDEKNIAAMVTVNLTIPMLLCSAMLPMLNRRPESAIVNVGSILGSIGYAGSSVYCSSKFGLRGFTESLRREWADSSVRIIYFAPRATNTELNSAKMQKMNRELGNAVDEPELVAQQLVDTLKRSGMTSRYLGWPEAFFVRINSLFPSLVDKALRKQLSVIRRFAASSNG